MLLRARTWLIPAALIGAWIAAGFLVVPALLDRVHRAEALPGLAAYPLSFYLDQWRGIVLYGAGAAVVVLVFVRHIRDSDVGARLVPEARPSDLGAIRALVAGVLLISTMWEDPASTAYLPRQQMNPVGVMSLLALLPGYESIAGSARALEIFRWLTASALFFAALGWKTRVTVPLAAALYLILGGWLRQYAWFYHTGLIPLYLLTVLAFLPAGDALSVDRLLRNRRGQRVAPDVPSRCFGWARYAVWTAMAIPYVAAGFSKLRNGGLEWLGASSFKGILLRSALRPMEFDFKVSLELATAPDWLFASLAVAAVAGELFFGTVLISRRARQVMPIVMVLMHVGILFLQNILFFDLILLQLIFLDFRPLLRRLRLHAPASRPALAASGWTGRRITVVLVVLFAACWVFRIEWYPLTGMQMFSTAHTEPLTYEVALAHTSGGEIVRAPIEQSIRAMSDSRYRRLLEMSFDPEREPLAREFMEAVVARWNATAEPPRAIRRIEVQRWEWHYLSAPADPEHGRLIDRVVFSFDDYAGRDG